MAFLRMSHAGTKEGPLCLSVLFWVWPLIDVLVERQISVPDLCILMRNSIVRHLEVDMLLFI